jgi:Ca2+-binding RTX toxin-like protein
MNIPQASADAVQMLSYMNNFVSGLFTNGPNGYDPLNGAAYYLNVNDPTTGVPYTNWGQLYSANLAPVGWLPANPTALGEPVSGSTDPIGGIGFEARAALADEITYTQSPQAIQAYGYVVSQIASYFPSLQAEQQAYQQSPMWDVMPRLPDGVYLTNNQMQIDTSGAGTVTLTATGGDSLLAVVGSGTATLTGGTGTTDLLYGGSGPTTLRAGTGNDYLFGGSGPTTFVDNTGNNYMHGGTGANVYQFSENNSGHDAIANFNPNTDQLKIAPNLDGNGITTTAQLIAGATVSNGNTTFHLSPSDDITLLGITQPANSLYAIIVS